jgi:Acetyltransferase (GNAT) domain
MQASAHPSLQELAEDHAVYTPSRPGFAREIGPRFTLVSGIASATVVRLRLEPDEVSATVEEVRALAQEHGNDQVLWWIGDLATPPDLVARLEAAGLTADEEEPVLTSMAITRSPAGQPSADVRRVETVEDFVTAMEIDLEAWNVPPADRARRIERQREAWPAMHAQGTTVHYLAYAHGEPVAFARAIFTEHGVLLLGGATLRKARGHGVYTSLVHRRWHDAVERGTPALVVQAGTMSRPILERLGFERRGEIRLMQHKL